MPSLRRAYEIFFEAPTRHPILHEETIKIAKFTGQCFNDEEF